MTGTKMLRGLAQTMEDLSVQLLDITGRIERELARQGEPDSTDNGAHLLYVTDEDREALEWVRDNGGLGAVQARVDTLKDTLDWLREHAGVGKDELVDYDELLDTLDRRLMPEGCEWPTVDGRKVDFKTPYKPSLGVLEAVSIYNNGACEVMSHDGIIKPVSEIHVVVLASDGEPLEVGQTVWEVDGTGHPFKVVSIRTSAGRAMEPTVVTCDVGDGTSEHFLPSQLTHQRPVLDADGVPIKVGDTVWDAEFGCEHVVTKVSDGAVFVAFEDESADRCDPASLTHRAPVLAADGLPLGGSSRTALVRFGGALVERGELCRWNARSTRMTGSASPER